MVVVVVAVIAFAGGSGGGASATTAKTSTVAKTHTTPATSTTSTSSATPAAAETSVTVLNATETSGLAHRVAANLQQDGFSQAKAESGQPPGNGQVTVVEYAQGDKASAEAVAHSLSVTQVQPMEAAVANLANSAKVVVIVGADQAAASP